MKVLTELLSQLRETQLNKERLEGEITEVLKNQDLIKNKPIMFYRWDGELLEIDDAIAEFSKGDKVRLNKKGLSFLGDKYYLGQVFTIKSWHPHDCTYLVENETFGFNSDEIEIIDTHEIRVLSIALDKPKGFVENLNNIEKESA